MLAERKRLYSVPLTSSNKNNYRKLIVVIAMSVLFIAGEIIGGIVSSSISVIGDASHLFTDLIGFIISAVCIYYSEKKSNRIVSFGFHRVEIIGAIANLFIIWAISLLLVVEATARIISREFVEDPKVMLIVAGAGLIVNIVMYFVLHNWGGHSHGLGHHCDHALHEHSDLSLEGKAHAVRPQGD